MRDAGLRQLFQKHLPEFHWQPIETGGTGRGIPDANYCFNGKEGWVEFKRVTGWKFTIAPEQIAWLERRARAGGRVFVAARRTASPQTFWLIHGHLARLGLMKNKILVKSLGNPASWDWQAIKSHLTC